MLLILITIRRLRRWKWIDYAQVLRRVRRLHQLMRTRRLHSESRGSVRAPGIIPAALGHFHFVGINQTISRWHPRANLRRLRLFHF